MKKIYEIYKHNVVSVNVRETKKLYLIEETDSEKYWGFGSRSQFWKDEVYHTPEEAIQGHIEKETESLDRLKKHLIACESKLAALFKLKEIYGMEDSPQTPINAE